MKKRILMVISFAIGILLFPYSAIEWIVTGKKTISAKLLDFAIFGEAENKKIDTDRM